MLTFKWISLHDKPAISVSSSLKNLSVSLSIVVLMVGVLVIIGWAANIPLFKSISPSWVAMKANTAICFVLSGIILLILNLGKPGRAKTILAIALSLIIIFIAVTSLLEYLFNFKATIDEVFFKDHVVVNGIGQHGRIAPQTAICFILLGFPLLLAGFKKINALVFQWLSLAAGIIAFFSLTGYLFSAQQLVTVSNATAIAFHTSLTLLIMVLAILFVIPDAGMMKVVTSDTSGGKLFRNIFPMVVLLVLLLGWLRMLGEKNGLYDNNLGVSIYATSVIIFFAFILFSNAASLFKSEESLKKSETNLRTIFENSSNGFLLLNRQGTVIEYNQVMYGIGRDAMGIKLEKNKNFYDQLTEDRREFSRSQWAKVFLGQAINYESNYPGVNGVIINYEITLTPIKDDKDKITGACMTVMNVTERKKAEEQKSLLVSIVNSSNDAIISKTPDGIITSWNKGAENMFGYFSNEIIGKHIFVLIPPQYQQQEAMTINKVRNGETVKHYDTERLRKDGQTILVSLTVSPIKDSKGNITGASKICTDITERKRAEEDLRLSEERYKTLFESMDQGFCVIEMIYDENDKAIDYCFVETNPAFIANTGLTDSVGKTIRELVPDNEAYWFEIYGKVARTGESTRFENEVAALNRYYDVFAYRIGGEGGNKVGIIFKDVTLQKKSEEQIRELNSQLEKKVIERTAQYEVLNKELEAFTYSVSHDLRAPLRAVNSYAQILMEEHCETLNDDGRQILENIKYNTKKSGVLIDELLSFSRLGRKEIIKTEIDMNDLTGGVIKELDRIIPNHAKILAGDLPAAQGDYTLVSQVVLNLLSNAIKYSSKKQTPLIEVYSDVRESKVVFSVKDNGAGFDMRYVEKLFGVFQRLHSEQEFEGNGVGLAIVQRIIMKHGGRIWAEGKVNEGACFHFTLN